MTKPPTPHPQCILKVVISLYSGLYYMGYKRTKNKADTTMENINGDKVRRAKWERTKDGKYKVFVDKTGDDVKVEEK